LVMVVLPTSWHFKINRIRFGDKWASRKDTHAL
jgi:hypothetical protein